MEESKDLLDYDEAKMYFGEDYHPNAYITLHTPTVGEIIEFGEKDYYSMVSTLSSIPSDMKSILFDMGIDYEEISDFELFYLLSRELDSSKTSILLGDLDLSKMEMYMDNDKRIMINIETGELIDELTYIKIVGFIRKLHGFKPKIEKAANKTTKRILIELDRTKRKESQNKPYTSQLIPLVSAMMRYPGFKYKSHELKECSIYEFMDTVQGSQIYIASTALLSGSYSGMVDTSKINKKEFNWMRSADE